MENSTPRRRTQPPRKDNTMLRILAGLFAVMCVVMISGLFRLEPKDPSSLENPGSRESTPAEPVGTQPPESDVLATASIGVTGDILPHGPVIKAAEAAASGIGYDFTGMFKYMKPYFQEYDYVVANLETTLGGPEAGEYMGWPRFNCPDSMIDALLDAGFTMMLTANNHAYDTGSKGFLRTQTVLKDKGMDYLGTVQNVADKNYVIKDINGIKIGMVCYSYNTGIDSQGCKQLNGQHTMSAADSKLISTFNTSILDSFYTEMQGVLNAMEADGAEATVVFIHWGDEYELVPDENQKAIAAKLCSMGVDVIVGGHPHEIQPFEVLTANGHTTYCLYSTGNALSNQRSETLTDEANKEYTEDGILFGVEFMKLKDGSVVVSALEALPYWLDKQTANGKDTYTMIPLDPKKDNWDTFGVLDVKDLSASYDRTMGLVAAPLNEARSQLGQVALPVKAENIS